MAGISHLDEIIDYKKKVINLLGTSQDVVELLADIPDIDMNSDEAYEVFDDNLYDYDYIDETIQEYKSYVMVEAETVYSSPTVKDVRLYVQIVVPKGDMKLDVRRFRGVKGNRKDNLARRIDLLLNNKDSFGIGRLVLRKVVQAPVPEKYTSTLLVYEIPNFARNRSLGNV